MLNKKSKISVEYLILTGFILLIIVVPSIIFLYSMANKSVYGTVNTQRAVDLGEGLVDNAKQMYYLGLYSKKIVEFNVPNNVGEFFIVELTESPSDDVHYYVGIIINNSKEVQKHFFESDVPLMSSVMGPYGAFVDQTNSPEPYISECSAPGNSCKFYNFRNPVTLPGKKRFKIETKMFPGTSEIGVMIVPEIN